MNSLRHAPLVLAALLLSLPSAHAVKAYTPVGYIDPFYGSVAKAPYIPPYVVVSMGGYDFRDYTDLEGVEDIGTFNYGYTDYGIDYDLDGFYEPPPLRY